MMGKTGMALILLFLMGCTITGFSVVVDESFVPHSGSILKSEQFKIAKTDIFTITKTISCSPGPCTTTKPYVFEWYNDIPSNAIIKDAKLRIVHQTVDFAGEYSIKAEIHSGSVTRLGNLTLSKNPVLDEFNLSLTDPNNVKLYLWMSLNSQANGFAIHKFDQIMLQIQYEMPDEPWHFGALITSDQTIITKNSTEAAAPAAANLWSNKTKEIIPKQVKSDEKFDTTIDSKSFDGQNLTLVFHHDSSIYQPISVIGKVNYTLSKVESGIGEQVTLKIYDWDNKFFRLKIGRESDLLEFGVPETKEIQLYLEDAKGNRHQAVGEFIDAELDQVKKSGAVDADSIVINEGVYDIKLTLNNSQVKQIIVKNLEIFEDGVQTIGIDTPEDNNGFKNLYALDPTRSTIGNATIVVNATGRRLMKCKEWNFNNQKCDGTWELFKDNLVPGTLYNFTLTPEDPGFGEIDIISAYHLDENKTLLRDVFNETSVIDDVWVKVPTDQFIRVTFEENLTNQSVINLRLRNNESLETYVQIYQTQGDNLVGETPAIFYNQTYDVRIHNLTSSREFDLKLVNDNLASFLEFDYIHDAAPFITFGDTFFEGFESGSLVTNGWISSGPGSNWRILRNNLISGAYLGFGYPGNGFESLLTHLDTTYITNITLSYKKADYNFESNDECEFAYHNGTKWTTLDSTNVGRIPVQRNFVLPQDTWNNSDFWLRFKVKTNHWSEFCLIDDLNLTGISPRPTLENLRNVSSSYDWILWEWDGTGEFVVFIDGVNVANTTDEFYNATGLTQGQNHTLKVYAHNDFGSSDNQTNTSSTWAPPYFNVVSQFDPVNFTIRVIRSYGLLDLEIIVYDEDTDKIIVRGFNLSGNRELVFESETNVSWGNDTYAVQANMTFVNMTIFLNSSGDHLYKCVNWSMTNLNCSGEWAVIQRIDFGQTYNITLNETDPGFVELVLPNTDVLNDGYADETKPSLEYGAGNRMYIENFTNNNKFSMLMFNISSLPHFALIDEANLTVRLQAERLEGGESMEVGAYYVNKSFIWEEGTGGNRGNACSGIEYCWNNRPSDPQIFSFPESTNTINNGDGGIFFTFQISTMIQLAVRDLLDNFSVMLAPTGNSIGLGKHDGIRFNSKEAGQEIRRPSLTISFHTIPVVEDVFPPAGTNVQKDISVLISANVTDYSPQINISAVLAVVTLPNGTNFTLPLVNNSLDQYESNFTTTLIGRHNVTIFANNSDGFVNESEKTWFYVVDQVHPASVTNLVNTTNSYYSILWNWTNPSDADFDKLIIYLNGSNIANTSNDYYNATGLIPNSSFEITLHTIDLSGNINDTNVTNTTRTLPLPDTTRPATVTNLANQSNDITSIYWTWTNSTSTDVDTMIVFLNGTNIVNTSNSFYNATGLSPNSSYELTIQTIDYAGNLNYTNVSDAAKTWPVPTNFPPGTVTNLNNQSSGLNWIYWNWTNPSDPDFDKAIVYINGTNIVNTTNNFYNATGLATDTEYQITLNTIDLTGIVNATNISDIARTANISISYAISLSNDLSNGINWSVLTLPSINLSALGNNGTDQTYYDIAISASGTNVDLYMKADGDLKTGGGDSIGLGNETYSFNVTDSTVPSDKQFKLTTNFSDNPIGTNLPDNSMVYLKFFLDIEAGQAAGAYSNNVSIKAVPTGESP